MTTAPAKNRALVEKETKRFDSAMKMLSDLTIILERDTKQLCTYARMLGPSKCAYGWAGKQLPKEFSTKMAPAVYKVARVPRDACRHARNFLFGATLHPEAKALQQLAAETLTARTREGRDLQWGKAQGSVAKRLRTKMSELQWEETGPNRSVARQHRQHDKPGCRSRHGPTTDQRS